jgi:hypothetical protein
MSSLQAPGFARAALGAEAQMRRSHSFWETYRRLKRTVKVLFLLEMGRRFWIEEEFRRMGGPRAPVLRWLERAADSAHDRRLFEIDKMKQASRSARSAEMQARILYEESEGR